jgi:alginate O-acetyltransferase complex protein AlgI
MLFATFDYLVFLPLVAALHWATRTANARASLLGVASLSFYAAWSVGDAVLLVSVIALAYFAGRVAESRPTGAWWWGTLATLLLPMCAFKYTGFLLDNLRIVLPVPAWQPDHLPIGVSFYTFQAIAYVIDVRRGMPAERHPVRFGAFLLFFPHLVAGPILRAGQLLPQLAADRRLTRDDVGFAVFRIATGLVKKIVVADVLRLGVVDTVFGDPLSFHALEAVVALYAYSLQIYCDFSGYTDLAIGSARLLGFSIPENFARPYQASSVADYWRRWHITLSDWVRDYVYYPLGGSRSWPIRNTMFTLLILALWHDASWSFVLYGVVHGLAVSVNRLWRRASPNPAVSSGFGVWWRWAITLQFVVFARILFRAADLDAALGVLTALADPVWAFPRFSTHALAVLAIGWAAHLSPVRWRDAARAAFVTLPWPLWGVALAAVGWLCAAWGAGETLAFVYDRF